MPVISSVFLVLALVLAVVIGPQTRPWSWGPAMLALGLSVSAALPSLWRKNRLTGDFGLMACGALVAAWFAWRAWISPVSELGEADLLLLAGVVGTFVTLRAIEGNLLAERILSWGIALLLLANILVVAKQVFDPTFSPVFNSRAAGFPSGFYAHYNEAANYFIASSLLMASLALWGRHATITRILWGVMAVAGLAAVYFTRSRGGILGAAIGLAILTCLSLIIAKRRGSRWFARGLIAVPILGIITVGFLLMGWGASQELRKAETGIESLLDNNSRLYYLGIAMSCVSLHPLAGGGSRSFSWESIRLWDYKIYGPSGARPEFVHNEIVQSATDYGLIGALLIVILLGFTAICAIVSISFASSTDNQDTNDGWKVGGLSAMAGMLVQSCFSFVFHLFPGALLFGLCLSLISRRSPGNMTAAQRLGSNIILSATALASIALLCHAGWKGTKVTHGLWPVLFSKTSSTSPEEDIRLLDQAIEVWPQTEFLFDRASRYQKRFDSSSESDAITFGNRSIDDYKAASRINPYDPSVTVNQASLCSRLGQDTQAEELFARTISLQGGMEAGFRGHYSLALHHYRKGLKLFQPESPEAALREFEIAQGEIEDAVKMTPPWALGTVGRDTRISISESLGAAREASGDYEGALEAYVFAASIPTGSRAWYRAGILYGKIAANEWHARRPGEALGHFIKARQEIQKASGLPEGVTPDQRVKYLDYLKKTISYLEGARIEPIHPIDQPTKD